MFGQQPLSSLFTSESLWLSGETSEEDENETEEPETSILEQARFDWACVWMEEEGFTSTG